MSEQIETEMSVARMVEVARAEGLEIEVDNDAVSMIRVLDGMDDEDPDTIVTPMEDGREIGPASFLIALLTSLGVKAGRA